MMPQAFTDLIDTCNKCILACENCIAAADSCEDLCEKEKSCSMGSENFIEKARECIDACEACIKVCDEMIIQFKKEGKEEHMEALNSCIKMLGECIKVCKESINTCAGFAGCRGACQDARDVCERTVMAVDECIESCEKHEVFYKNVTQY
jgi:hypothetical protein